MSKACCGKRWIAAGEAGSRRCAIGVAGTWLGSERAAWRGLCTRSGPAPEPMQKRSLRWQAPCRFMSCQTRFRRGVPGQNLFLRLRVAPFRALFVGHLGYRPNNVATRRLVRSIMPALRDRCRGAELILAGRRPHRRLVALVEKKEWVSLHADPTDLDEFYAASSCAVIPLTEGGGTRLKVLEAMAFGRPVIATAKAVEGLNLRDGETFLAAGSDAEFVAACLRLMKEPELAASLVRRAAGFVQDRHGSRAILEAVSAGLPSDLRRTSFCSQDSAN